MYRQDILQQLKALQSDSPDSNLEKIEALLFDENSNRELGTQLLYSEGYSPLQVLTLKSLLMHVWGIGKRITVSKLDDQTATLSGICFFSKTKAMIEAEAESSPIAAHIQSKWGNCDFYQIGHNRWDEVYGIPNNQYIGFAALLDGIPFLVVNDFIEVNDGKGPYNSFVSNISVCILPEIPKELKPCAPLNVKIQLAYEQSALCPHWVSLEGEFDSGKEAEFECLIEAMDEAGWGMNLGFRRLKNTYAFEEIFDLQIPREEEDIQTKTAIQINEEDLLKITNHQNFADFTAAAETFKNAKLSSGNTITDFLYQLLG